LALPAASSSLPVLSEQSSAGRYVITLTETERFEGALVPKTFACEIGDLCLEDVRVEVRGTPYEYRVFAALSDSRIRLNFTGKTKDAPRLGYGTEGWIVVAIAADGSGNRDAALAALDDSRRRPPDFLLRELAWIPLANVRVNVRRYRGPERNL
jgi:hypothetical protein